jgi:hypothetical protein
MAGAATDLGEKLNILDDDVDDPAQVHQGDHGETTDPVGVHQTHPPETEVVEHPLAPDMNEAETILGNLLKAPAIEMPLPENSSSRLARRRSVASQMRRRGRASTILSDQDRLGG